MSGISPEIQLRNARLAPHLMYICPECGKGFRSQPEWRTHLNIKHDYRKKSISDFDFRQVNERYHECQMCFKWVASEKHTLALIQYHRFLHLPFPQTYRCLHCREAFSRRRALNDHLEDKHMREIKQYEARVKMGRFKQQQSSSKSQMTVEKEDLIRKALLNSQIDLEAELLNSGNKSTELNASELALDRSLNALEELMRQDMILKEHPEERKVIKNVVKPQNNWIKTETQICVKTEEDSFNKKSMYPSNDGVDEVVTIEIDALNADEIEKLINAQSLDQNANRLVREEKRNRQKVSNEDYETAMVDEIRKHIGYLCPECAEEFTSEQDWREHVFTAHDFATLTNVKFKIQNGSRSYRCMECFEILQTIKRPELLRHYFQHLPYRSYLKCGFCGRTKSNTAKILNHIRYNHQDEILLVLNDKIDLEGSMRDIGMEFKCKQCDRKFLLLEKLQKHTKYCERKLRSSSFEEGFKEIIQHLDDAKKRMSAIRAQMN